MTDIDIFGDIVDADLVEDAVRTTLQAWIPAHIAHQERRRGLAQGALPQPRSWPTLSQYDIAAHDTMPAILIVSPGTNGATHDRGAYRVTWRIQIAVAVAGKTEAEARFVAALYLAAVKGALIQNPTLGGTVEHCYWTGTDDHAFGTAQEGGQRAFYGTEFAVVVADAVSSRKGTVAPPPDPYDPPDIADRQNIFQPTVTAIEPGDTP